MVNEIRNVISHPERSVHATAATEEGPLWNFIVFRYQVTHREKFRPEEMASARRKGLLTLLGEFGGVGAALLSERRGWEK